MPDHHTISLVLIRRSDQAVWLLHLGLVPATWDIDQNEVMYEQPLDQAVFYPGPRGTRQGINYLFVNVEWRYGYDANAVLLKNFTKIDSCALLYHRFEQNVPGNNENLDMTEPDSKGRWWTPRGQNPWAWAFGTP